jgi:lysozyme family protein
MDFDTAFATLLKHEGGFSDHPDDPGGKTRYGITEAVAREVGYRGNMEELPIDLARRIYFDRYWTPCRADDLPGPLRYPMFDAAVNSGVRAAVKWLQRAVGSTVDGVIGPETIKAANMADVNRVRVWMIADRLRAMTWMSGWPSFSRGWARRICDVLEG